MRNFCCCCSTAHPTSPPPQLKCYKLGVQPLKCARGSSWWPLRTLNSIVEWFSLRFFFCLLLLPLVIFLFWLWPKQWLANGSWLAASSQQSGPTWKGAWLLTMPADCDCNELHIAQLALHSPTLSSSLLLSTISDSNLFSAQRLQISSCSRRDAVGACQSRAALKANWAQIIWNQTKALKFRSLHATQKCGTAGQHYSHQQRLNRRLQNFNSSEFLQIVYQMKLELFIIALQQTNS